MNYRPDPKEFMLWDTWMYSEGERAHLFYLSRRPGCNWEHVGHCVTDDLLHWEELPTIQVRCPDDEYDVGVIGTGMVFPAPSGGYMMSYTANLDSDRQRIAFMHSDDLIDWKKRYQEPAFGAELPHYELDSDEVPCRQPAFRDAYVHRVGDAWEALVGAHSAHGPLPLKGCIARYRSTDPELRNWEALPPLFGPGHTMLMEVPEHFEIGGRHYLVWSTAYNTGFSCDGLSRSRCGGTFYAVADSYEGPYHAPEDSLLIGASGEPYEFSYVGRTIMWNGERLLYHHIGGPCPSLMLPKRIIQQPDGALKAGYWRGIEAIHGKERALPLGRIEPQGEFVQLGDWKRLGNDGLRGSMEAGGSTGLVPVDMDDVHLRCHVTLESGAKFGVSLRDPGQFIDRANRVFNKQRGFAIQADFRYGEWHYGTPVHTWLSRIDPVEVIREAPTAGRTYQLDLIARDIYFEAYVDGVWTFSRVVDKSARRGGIGFFIENGAARFEGIQAWDLEPTIYPFVDGG